MTKEVSTKIVNFNTTGRGFIRHIVKMDSFIEIMYNLMKCINKQHIDCFCIKGLNEAFLVHC